MREHRLSSPVAIFSYILFPVLTAVFYVVYSRNPVLYFNLLTEDRFVEWLTFFGLLLSGLTSLAVVVVAAWKTGRVHWFFIVFGVFCVFIALEEISYGQRVFNIDTPEFFQETNNQDELNLHNIPSALLGIHMKRVAGVAFFVYGVLLPLLGLNRHVGAFFNRIGFATPPLFLAPGFVLGALATIDRPTGMEEEIGELFFALALLIFTASELLSRLGDGAADSPLTRPLWGFALTAALVLVTLGGGLWGESYFIARRTVAPLSGPDVANLYNIPAPSGETPCGIFDVGTHGFRVIRLPQYPQCTAPSLDVYCLDSNARWNQDNVFDVTRSPNGRLLRFNSGQHGTCAIFPR